MCFSHRLLLITLNNKDFTVFMWMLSAKWEQMCCDNSFLEREMGQNLSHVGVLLTLWKSLFGSLRILVVGLHKAYCHSSFASIFLDDGLTACPAGGLRCSAVNKGTAKDKVTICVVNSITKLNKNYICFWKPHNCSYLFVFIFHMLFANCFSSSIEIFCIFSFQKHNRIRKITAANTQTHTDKHLSVIISSCPWEPLTTANNVGPVLSLASSAVPWQQLNHTSRLWKKETSSLQSLGTSKQGNSLAVVEPENNGKGAFSI